MALFMNLLYMFYVYLSLRESQKQQREPQSIDAPSDAAVAAVAGPRARNSSFTAAETGSAAASFVGRGSRVAVAWLR